MQLSHWLTIAWRTGAQSMESLRSAVRPRTGAECVNRQLDLGQMEERVMLSATPLAAALTALPPPGPEVDLTAKSPETIAYIPENVSIEKTDVSESASLNDPLAITQQIDGLLDVIERSAAEDAAPQRHELLVIDASTQDYEQLVTDVLSRETSTLDFEIFVLDDSRDGISQLNAILAGQSGIDALHLVSHGTDGSIRLGDTWLNGNNVESYSRDISSWNASFNAGADLLLYGCEIARGNDGISLVTTLGSLTGADVAASVDGTGSLALGGNWILEHQFGEIETNVVASSMFQVQWSHLLTVAPQLDLDADDSSGQTGADFAVTWTEDAGPVSVSDSDATLNDLDSANLQSLTISIGNLNDGLMESLSANVAGTSIAATYDSGSGVLTLSGSDTLANYQQVLRTVTYNNTSQAPETTARIITFVANDGTDDSNLAATTVAMVAHNDAPVLDNSGTPTLTTITEDATNNAGDLVSAIVGLSISDADAGAVEGIAVTSLDNSNGTWQFSIDNGASWADVGVVADNSSLLLRSVDRLRFVPDTLNADTATVTYRAWDRTSGTQGAKVDTSTTGGTTAFSGASETASISVTAVNDAPVLDNSGTPTLTTITEDTTSSAGDLVSAIVGLSISDADAGAVEGIAVTSLDNSNGTWQFSIDNGSSWADVGTVTNSSSLLLRSVDRLRFVPDTLNADTATVTYRAWDRTSGTHGTKVDTSTCGGTTAFSDATETASIVVTAVNDAPVLDGGSTPFFDGILQDDTTNSGDLVSDLIASATGDLITDADIGAVEGIAITGVNSANGTWQFSTNGGSSWIDIGAVSDSSARVLTATATDRIRFVPNASYWGTTSLTFRAWDTSDAQANGGAGVDVSVNGGTTAYSTVTQTASLLVNDAPVLDNSGTPTLTTITEDEVANSGDLVSSILGASISDINSGALEGIAVIAVDNSNGTWQYSTNNGSTWSSVGTVADNSALLLRSVDRLRFVPDARNADTATVTYRAWDQASGTQGTKVDASSNGGATVFSAATETATITATAVNDAPVLNGVASPYFTRVLQDDTTNSGDLVSDVIASVAGDLISDVDIGAVEGIAITAIDSSNGTWQFSTDGGSSWNDIAAVSDSSARVLTATATDRIRFVPNPSYWGTTSLTFRAWDTSDAQTNGSTGVDVSTNGGTTPFSSSARTATLWVNDAPVLDNSGTPTLTTITEDEITNSGDLVSTILGASISDINSGALEGIAVTSTDNSNGTWQYSTNNGSTWSSVGTVADNSALLLRSVDRLRFVPDAKNLDVATVIYRAWDQTSGTQGTKVNASSNGGTTAFSTASETASINATAVNDAPVLNNSGSPTLTAITEDDVTNSGDLVSAIAGASISDVDNGALEGIAVTALDNSNGTWQYSIDNGSTWAAVGVVAENSALLLRAVDRLRFVPDTLNADTATVTYRAWDQTSGSQGTKIDSSVNGGVTAFSSAVDTASITVSAVNDAPVLDNSGTPTLTTITEDDTNGAGDLVASLVGLSISDVDNGALEGIAITASDNSNGSWQFSIDNGSTWASVGVVAENSALLLRSNDRLRFVPDAMNADAASVTYRAWDQSSGVAGTKVDASTNGGTTALSTASNTAGITVTAVNDAPVLDNSGTPVLTSITEDEVANSGDLVSAIVGGSLSDVDSGAIEGIAVTALNNSNGTWQFSIDNGSTWGSVGSVADNSALLLRMTDRLRFVPDTLNADTATITYRGWDQTSGTQGTKVNADTNGGVTAFSAATETASITVTAVNDAPVLDNSGTPTLTTITEDEVSNAGDLVSSIVGLSISDVDNGALEGIAITASDNSNGSWQFSTDNGSSWASVGVVAENSALLLRSNDRLRFVPDAMNADAASVSYRAWDQSSGVAGTKVDASTNGGTTALSTASDTTSITVTAVNDAPVLDLDANNSSGQAGADYGATCYEVVGTVGIVDVDVTLSDVDDTTFSSATITITNLLDGVLEGLSADTFGTAITSSYDSAAGVLTLSGADSAANYQQVLRTAQYFNSSIAPATVTRQITIVVNDGGVDSNVATTFVNMEADLTPPSLDLDANNSSGRSGADFATTFAAGDGPINIGDTDAVLSDYDSTTLTSLTATIVTLYDGPSERLSADTSGTLIAASYSVDSGVLTLSGTDTLAHYQQVLRSITYDNLLLAPTTVARQITVTVNDGATLSEVATAQITVERANVPPVVEDVPEPAAPPATEDQPGEDSSNGEPVAEVSSVEAVDSVPLPEASVRDAGTNAAESMEHEEAVHVSIAPPVEVELADSGGSLATFVGTPGRTGVGSSTGTLSQTALSSLVATSVDARVDIAANETVYYSPRALDTDFLSDRMDAASEATRSDTEFDSVVIGSTTILATAFTAGYTFWVLRGGYLLASLVSSMPAWRMLDPLPILEDFCHEGRDDTEDESLQSMVIK